MHVKIILLDYQNNYVESSEMMSKKFGYFNNQVEHPT